jgi:phytoene dehydrogenase-like protein
MMMPDVNSFMNLRLRDTSYLHRIRHGVLIAPENSETMPPMPPQTEGSTVVVVGAGVGGLACACRIASSDEIRPYTKVIVLEKNPSEMVGGRCGSFFRDVKGYGSFRHERGPSLLLLKDVYLELFDDCNKKAEDFGLEMKSCEPAYQVVFEDGDALFLGFPAVSETGKFLKSAEQVSRQKMNSFERDGAKKWDEYMQSTEAFLDCGLPNFIEERLDLVSFPSFIREALKDGLKAWPLKPHSAVLDATFESEKMKALASFQDLYVGLEPYANNKQLFGGVVRTTAPAVFGLLAALELHPTNKRAGVYAPIGGFQKVSKAFEGLAIDCGVEIMYRKTITDISEDGVWITDENKKNSFIAADLIVCNADLPFATKTLVKKEGPSPPRYDWDDSFDYSSGEFILHFCLQIYCS